MTRSATTAARALVWMLAGALAATAARAATLAVPADGDVVGAMAETHSVAADTLADIARRHSLGFGELRWANPELDPWLPPAGSRVTLPRRFILPRAPRAGIVLNLAERRLYYYPSADEVVTYPVGIGRPEWPTPTGRTAVVGKLHRPAWYPPPAVRAEHAARGEPLPAVVPPGPDNPLGEYALQLGLPGYLIHGTNLPGGVGLAVSHGCVRLYPEDIAALAPRIATGTPVHIVDQPFKAGQFQGQLYVEVHPGEQQGDAEQALREALAEAAEGKPALLAAVDWTAVRAAIARADGLPVVVSRQQLAGGGEPP